MDILQDSEIVNHHEDSVFSALHVEQAGLLFSLDGSGNLRAWHASSGVYHPRSGPRGIRTVPPRVGVISMTMLTQQGLLALGSDDSKIRFFDVATLRHDLTFNCEGARPLALDAFDIPYPDAPGEAREPRQALAWGDSAGVLHIMVGAQIAELRTQNEVVPLFPSSLADRWDIDVFRGRAGGVGAGAGRGGGGGDPWFAVTRFVAEVGLHGVLVAGSSSGLMAVVSVSSMSVTRYLTHHRLAVKALAWCSRHNNVMASAGLDRAVRLWRLTASEGSAGAAGDGGRGGEALVSGTLSGHTHCVTDLAFAEARDVLFSLDSRSVCLAWDLASRTLVGRLEPLSSNPFDITHKVTRLTVHGKSRHLVTWTNHPRFWGVLPLDLRDESERVTAHEARVVAAAYNRTFDRLLTADETGSRRPARVPRCRRSSSRGYYV